MKKIYIVLIVLIGISISCTKNFEEFNTDTKHPDEVPGKYLFANAQKALADQVASTNVNLNIWKLIAQYWTETTYTDEANYDLINRTIPDGKFRTYYRDILRDFKEASVLISGETALVEDEIVAKANMLYIIDILNVYCYSRMVDMFGMIPYSEALDIHNLSPVYEDGYEIYKDLINKANTAHDGLNADFGSFGSDDLYFSGDVAMWKKFAKSLLVKIAINLGDYDDGLARTTIEGAYAGAFTMGDICEIQYPGGANSNPLFVDLIQSGRHDFVAANTIIDLMNGLEDPRLPAYFTQVDTSSNPDIEKLAYKGGKYGYSSSFSQHSHIADPIQNPQFPMTLMDFTEVSFYLAEAAARGYSVGADAETHYNNAIMSSFDQWNLSAADASAYLAKPEVAYTTAAGEWQQKIGTQAWLAYYVRGFVAYTSYRRLDYPQFNAPPSPETDDGQVPKRFTFPVNEQTLNGANYTDAAQRIGPLGDVMHQKVFWDLYDPDPLIIQE